MDEVILMGDLSPHFNKSEFACHHCGKLPQVAQSLIDGLEQLRALAGQRVFINDGYRCPQHNQQVGGAPNSMHIVGRATDIQIDQQTTLQTLELVKQISVFTAYGLYVAEHFVHVDVRPPSAPGHIATWGRLTANGNYVTLDLAVQEWNRLHGKP